MLNGFLGKVFAGIILMFLLFAGFSSYIIDGIKGWRTVTPTESFIVTTAGGVTTSNVTLALELYQSHTSEVIAVSSNITESPVATSYDKVTQNLLISALQAGKTRTISVRYYGLPDDNVMKAIGPFLAVLIIGGLAFATLYGVWKDKQRKGG